MIKTARLLLVPATIEMLKAEVEDRSGLAALLNAYIPATWPPEPLKDAFPWFIEQLEKNPGQECWYSWYALLADREPAEKILVASVGFKGSPNEFGIVEIGYSVLDEYQGKSIATEMVLALSEWAFSQSGVKAVMAETAEDNLASKRVLEKCKFLPKNQQVERVVFVKYYRQNPFDQ